MNLSSIPFCDGSLISNYNVITPADDKKAFYIGVFYLIWGVSSFLLSSFVFSVISKPPLIQYSCYKLMTINCFLDLVNMTNGLIISGILSIFHVNHCNQQYTVFMNVMGVYVMASWACYTAAAEVLAINRVLEFAKPSWSQFLFQGHRSWLWIAYIFLYSLILNLLVLDAFYFYNPYLGMWFNRRTSQAMNYMHVINNFSKFGFISISYVLMIFFMYRMGNTVTNVSRIQIKASIQAMVIAILAAGTTLGYLVAPYIPLGYLDQYTGVIGEILWQSLHTGTSIIYIVMNQTVRERFLDLLRGFRGVSTRTNDVQLFSKIRSNSKSQAAVSGVFP
ncbi:hypothetical protein L596_017534 [Steinernema carpocapsae]|uniref:G-protein coupled receptors family 1 profile domain-containing protein n=1 Tax=Steinernema carpocapsae TaxID=34508 RepID=A0A4U5N2P9_STECR|nr:hypothetical protein L596_017534 [Steinernema carpocapsae]